MIRPRMFTVTILEAENVTPEVKRFLFKPSEPIEFLHGQYVNLRFSGEKRYHAFSIASSPKEQEHIELVIKLEHDFTHKLFEAKVGDSLEALGPIGKFTAEEEMQGDVVMIAGGVGVTPLLSVVRCARDFNKQERQFWLFYSCRTRETIIHEEELRRLHEQNDHIHVIFTLTREEGEGWDGERGHVDGAMLQKHLGSLENKTYYMCGPDRMVKGIKAMLTAAGVPEERMQVESWG